MNEQFGFFIVIKADWEEQLIEDFGVREVRISM